MSRHRLADSEPEPGQGPEQIVITTLVHRGPIPHGWDHMTQAEQAQHLLLQHTLLSRTTAVVDTDRDQPEHQPAPQIEPEPEPEPTYTPEPEPVVQSEPQPLTYDHVQVSPVDEYDELAAKTTRLMSELAQLSSLGYQPDHSRSDQAF